MAGKGKKKDIDKASRKIEPNSTVSSSHVVARAEKVQNAVLDSQQSTLDVFKRALPIPDLSNLRQVIQEVKGHLFRRDFATAFGQGKFLHAYALRWSAARALAYTDILTTLEVNYRVFERQDAECLPSTEQCDQTGVLCIGGGAGAEIAALAAVGHRTSVPSMTVTVVDSGDWSLVLKELKNALVGPPALPASASVAAQDAKPDAFTIDFSQQDVLEVADKQQQAWMAGVSLITIMFTLNELFSSSIAKTTRFLLQLTDSAKVGTWLLVVDSPGSYSEISLGGDSGTKRYPMKWLLDHTLLEVATDSSGEGRWRKHEAEESRWFRVADSLKYPLELENTRYQIHLYQRV